MPPPTRNLAALLLAPVVFAASAAFAGSASLNNPNVPTGEGDAIFVLGEGGYLEPIGIRRHGAFIDPGLADGGPSDKLRMESNATILVHGGRVHVVFGRRVVATIPVKIENGAPSAVVPPSLHLNDNVSALASPTLGGSATSPRRAPTAAERAAALALAARAVGAASASRLTVANLTAIDLGRGMAVAGTVNLRGPGVVHADKRLFFIAESDRGTWRATLSNVMSIKVTEPLMEESSERLIDAIDLGDGTPSVVTRIIGYDAHTYAIYSRKNAGWKQVYTGGGAAL